MSAVGGKRTFDVCKTSPLLLASLEEDFAPIAFDGCHFP